VQAVNCGLTAEVVVLAQPQKLFAVLEEHFDLPTMVVRCNDLTGRELRIIRQRTRQSVLHLEYLELVEDVLIGKGHQVDA
jgi:hypothetical protein